MNEAVLRFLSYTWFSTMETVAIYFRHHDTAVVLPADDLEDHVNMTYK